MTVNNNPLIILRAILIWCIGLVLFIPFGIIIMLFSFIMDPKHLDKFIKGGCRFIMRAMGIRIKTHGLENVDFSKTSIYMANHVNLFDGIVLYGHIPAFVRGVELETHFDWPFWGFLIKRMGMIPISRVNAKNAIQSLQTAGKRIHEGTSIIILPEGTRTLTGELGEFKRGPFILAASARVNVVPVVMLNAYAIKRKGSFNINPGTMHLVFGKPILAESYVNKSPRDIQQLVNSEIINLINENRHLN